MVHRGPCGITICHEEEKEREKREKRREGKRKNKRGKIK